MHKGKMKGKKYYSGVKGHGEKERKSLSHLGKGDLKDSFDVQNNVKGMSLDMGGASGVGSQGLFGGKNKVKKRFGY